MSFQARVSAGTRFLITSVFILGSIFGLQAQGDCDCTNCPQYMPDNFTGSFLINVQNASNPTLGQNGQGVCGVSLSMDHEYIGDIRITLTSPAGQTVTLIGPIGLFGATDGTSWNIDFVPCSSPDVAPDPGFSSTWNNNQSWGLGGAYTGTYYPSVGCLQNFNTGSVNGTWSLTVTDGQASDVGNFYDYEIIFCDPSGIQCFSCAANAGALPQPDVAACEGSSLLDLDLPPAYTASSPAPPAGEYSYTYIISGAGGIIQGYDPAADLSSYPAGVYTVCGMSYLTAQENLIPSPDGSLTMTQIRNMLNSTTPPLCGKVTTNCVNVTINAAPQDIENTVEMCGPGCYLFNGINRCQSGTYVANLQQNGCPYTSTLYLTIKQPSIKNIVEVVCDGGCSTNPSFPGACSGGFYTTTLMNQAGCDSIVNLTITVVSANAVINNTPVVPCGGGSVQLSGLGSSIGAGFTYSWSASNGGNIVGNANGLNINVNAAGDYQLKVCRLIGGNSCCDSAQVTLTAATDTPNPPDAIFGPVSVCKGQTINYNVALVPGVTSYTWTFPSGVTINSGGTTIINNVTWNSSVGGPVCVQTNSACGTSDPICINVAVDSVPTVTLPQGPITVCSTDTSNYSIPVIANATSYTWTVTAPAQIVSGQNTRSIRVVWNGATAASVCVNAANSCGSGVQKCLPVVVTPKPVKPVISGPTTACAGAVSTYTIAAIPGAADYIWTATNGVVASPTDTTTVQVTWNAGITSGTICVHAANSCGISPDTCLTVALGVPPPQAVISGPTQLCAGDTAVYTVTAIAGATGYTWQVPAGGTILSGQNTISATILWSAAPGGNVGIIVAGSCGAAPVVNYPVIVHAIPVANAGVDQQLCGLSTPLVASGGTGQWSVVSGPGTITFINPGSDSSIVTTTLSGTHLFNWTVNSFGCLDSDTVSVQFNSSPVAGAITPVCDNANENYTISFPISGGLAPYTVPGGTVTAGVFTSAAIVSALPYQFVITDANGCISATISGAYNCNCATNAGTMTLAPLEVCEGDTAVSVTVLPPVLDGNDVRSFVLHEGSGTALVNPIAQNTTGRFTFQVGMVFGQTYYISSVAGNNMGGFPAANDPCRSVSQGQPVIFYQNPVSNAGVDSDTCGLSIVLAAGNGIGQGTWSVATSPAGGNLIFANINNPTSVATSNVFGTYTLIWTLNNHSCTATDQVDITFHGSPSAGTAAPTCNAINTAYTVTFPITGGTAPYLVNGTSVAAGGSYTSAPINSGLAYSFVITDANGCVSAPVTGSAICDCTTEAGVMSTQILNACDGTTITAQHIAGSETLDGDDVTGYILHTGSGMAIVNPIAQNTTGVFGFTAGMTYGQTYYVSFVAGNSSGGFPNSGDPCFSVAPGQPVAFLANPAPIAGADSEICGNTITLNATQGNFPGVWSFVSGPGGVAFSNAQAANSSVTVGQTGTYVFRWTETNVICTGFDEVSVDFHTVPTAAILDEVCNSTSTQYQVVLQVSNGTGPFTTTGLAGTFAGTTFTSALITSNTNYNVVITDANGCSTTPLSGIKNCNCLTDAGTMNTTPLKFCVDMPAVAVWNNDGQLDGDDMAGFILHTQSGSVAGQILGVSAIPQFSFAPNLSVGVTYYISAIAGNNVNGVIDPNDICLSVAPGTPVQWKALPTATLSGTTTICEGSTAQLTFGGTGDYPLSIVWSNGTGTNQTATLSSGTSVIVPVTPAATTIYNLVSVSDGTLPTCSATQTGSATVTVRQPLSAGTATTSPAFCQDNSTSVVLSGLITGADAGGAWTETSLVPSTGSGFNAGAGSFNTAGQAPGVYRFAYTVTPLTPCPTDQEQVQVTIHPEPVADAGADKTLDCDVTSAIIGGTGTTLGAGISYVWLNGATPVGSNSPTIEVTEGGNYSLSVTNTFGCTDQDNVVVTLDNEQPQIGAIQKQDISCFGKTDGVIRVLSVTGGHPPYLYSMNGQAFSSQKDFVALIAGSYQIEVLDANGCSSSTDLITVVEPPLLVTDLGGNLNVSLGDSISLQAQVNRPLSALDTIIWQPVFDADNAHSLFQYFRPIQTTTVDFFVRDTNGCTATDQVLIFVDTRRHVYVPNIFDPTGSGINVLTVYGGRDVEQIKDFKIYDRWGDLMYSTKDFYPNDESKGWDGQWRGKSAQPGVYVWTAVILFRDGETELYSGDVTILK